MSLVYGLIHRLIQLVSRLLSSNKLPILIYHRVLEKHDVYRACTPTVDEFRGQMTILKRYYNPVSLEEGLRLLQQKKLPANSVCVTFDDGYLDNLTLAAPVIKDLGVPATVYVASAFSDGKNMWNDDLVDLISEPTIEHFDLSDIDLGVHQVDTIAQRRALISQVLNKIKYIPVTERALLVDALVKRHNMPKKASKMMTKQQLIQLADFGITVAAHTHDHPIMAVLPLVEQRAQLTKNLQCLQSFGIETQSIGFAYPNGRLTEDYTLETAKLVKELGFSHAVTTHHGVATPTSDLYQLPRVSAWDKRPLYFHLRLLLDIMLR